MISVQFMEHTTNSGLGNQMFMAAAAIGTAIKLNTEYSVKMEHDFFMGPFNHTNKKLPRYYEPNFHYTEINQDNIELYGYFQSEKYFSHCKETIRYLFSPSHEIEEYIEYKYNALLKKNTCSLHVRRGDYLQLSEHHYNLELEYYTKIMDMFPDFYYVCLSDDIQWCKENIKVHEYISDRLGVEFHLMSMMKNNIIANSSFSWWASWLGNKNGDKLIFAPEKSKWFGPKKQHLNVDDLYCKNWIYNGCQ